MSICIFSKCMVKIVLNFCLLCLLTGSVVAQDTFSFNQGKPERKKYYEEIPYEKFAGKIIVTVELGGKPRRFIWDTGATMLVTESLAKELGCEVIHKTLLYDAYDRADTAKIVRLDDVKIGNLSFHGVPSGIISDNSIFTACLQVDGFIGSNICRKSVVEFRSDEQKIILTNRAKRIGIPKQKGIKMLNVTMQSSPIITVKLSENVNLEVLFDSGDDAFLALSERNYEQLNAYDSTVFQIKETGMGSNDVGIWGNAPDMTKFLLGLDYFSVDTTAFKDVSFQIMNADNSRIGIQLLDYGRVMIDYARSRFYFKPFNTGRIEFEPGRIWQVMPTFQNGKFVVGMIWGDFNEVALGDEILQVDGVNIAEKDLCELFVEGVISDESKEQIELLIRTTAGEEKTVTIKAIR